MSHAILVAPSGSNTVLYSAMKEIEKECNKKKPIVIDESADEKTIIQRLRNNNLPFIFYGKGDGEGLRGTKGEILNLRDKSLWRKRRIIYAAAHQSYKYFCEIPTANALVFKEFDVPLTPFKEVIDVFKHFLKLPAFTMCGSHWSIHETWKNVTEQCHRERNELKKSLEDCERKRDIVGAMITEAKIFAIYPFSKDNFLYTKNRWFNFLCKRAKFPHETR